MVIIDPSKCVGCGACVADCFPKNLSLSQGKALVKGSCMLCGHCVAVCPSHAVSIPDYPDDVQELGPQGFALEPEALLNAVRFRRSIRQYQRRPVEREKLAWLLEAGRYTETGGNRQDLTYLVVQDTLPQLIPRVWESLNRLATQLQHDATGAAPYAAMWRQLYLQYRSNPAQDGLFFGAPVLLAIASASVLDGGLAASNLELAANTQGLGVLFSGFIQRALSADQELMEELGLGGRQLSACMLVGYPAVTYRRSAPRRAAQVLWR